jgi:hypothetical protein
MKLPRRLSTLLLLGAVFLAACGGAATPEASQVDFILTEGVQTMVASYFSTQTALAPETATPTPTGTSTPAYTPVGFLNNVLTPSLTATFIWIPLTISPTVTITGTPPTALPSSLASGCNNLAAWGAANITVSGDLLPGSDVSANWSVQNNGTCAWQGNYRIQQVGGPCPEFVGGYPDRAIPAGNKGTISAVIETPRQNGTSTCSYKLSDGSKTFGATLSITFTIKKPSPTDVPATQTPTPTHTTEATSTPTPTATP